MPDPSYLKGVREWCDRQGLLLIFDEIQTGVGRLGSLFGYQHYGVEPDVITLAKGLGGGVPVSAILAKQEAAVFTPGDHGSTFGGNPLACAVAYAVVKYVIENNVTENVRRSGDRLAAGLRQIKKDFTFVADVRGVGLLQALQFNQDMSADVLTAALTNRLLVNAVRPNALRFMPALLITEAEVDEGLQKLRTSIEQVASARGL